MDAFATPTGLLSDAAQPNLSPQERSLIGRIIDAIDAGLIVCDENGTVLLSNSAARRDLAESATVRLHDGALFGCMGDNPLGPAISAACRRGIRQVVALRCRGERLYAAVTPLSTSDGTTHALVMLGRREPCSQISLELLGIREGLTPSERSVLAELASKRSPARIAHDRDVALSTVRSQIGSVHAKLGVRSRHELLCLVGGVPALAPALHTEAAAPRDNGAEARFKACARGV